MEEKPEMAETTKMDADNANPKSPCRGGRCRVVAVAVLAVVGSLLAWYLTTDTEEAALAPTLADHSSTLLPGVAGPAPAPMAAPGAGAPQLPGLDVMAGKLAKRLESEPADGEGWALLARTYLELGDLAKADAAYANALRLRPGDEAMKADYTAARAARGASPSP